MKSYSEKLIELMKEKKLSYSGLENKLKDKNGFTTVTRQTISNHCNGQEPNLYTVKLLAEYFKVSPMYLIDDTIENKESLENIKIEKVLNLSDKSIKHLGEATRDSKNELIESNFFVSTMHFMKMIKDLKLLNKKSFEFNNLKCSNKQKTANIKKLQDLCNSFHHKFKDIPNAFDYFDAIGMWNILDSFKNDIIRTKDDLDEFYISTLNTLSHSIEKSIKVIHSEMKDSFVYFIDSI